MRVDRGIVRQTLPFTTSNVGDTDLTGVVVTDTPPAQTKIVSAPGATIANNVATWNVEKLKAGEKRHGLIGMLFHGGTTTAAERSSGLVSDVRTTLNRGASWAVST